MQNNTIDLVDVARNVLNNTSAAPIQIQAPKQFGQYTKYTASFRWLFAFYFLAVIAEAFFFLNALLNSGYLQTDAIWAQWFTTSLAYETFFWTMVAANVGLYFGLMFSVLNLHLADKRHVSLAILTRIGSDRTLVVIGFLNLAAFILIAIGQFINYHGGNILDSVNFFNLRASVRLNNLDFAYLVFAFSALIGLCFFTSIITRIVAYFKVLKY